MNAIHLAVPCLLVLYLGYRWYSRYLSAKVFHVADDQLMPSEEFGDDIDFVPTRRTVLFGHHFSSVAGAAPILGPAIAVIWGWLPALIWIVMGSVFMGAVHDYGSLILSALFKGRSIGSITGDILGRRARNLFLFIIFLLTLVVIAVFAYLIAGLFVLYPGSVIPINFEIIVALYIGWRFRKNKKGILLPAIAAQIVLYFMIYIGFLYPLSIPPEYCPSGSPVLAWVLFLMVYGFVASVLPVNLLLQPRDYINAHKLIAGIIVIYAGMFMAAPKVVAPALALSRESPPWFPLLFITIACGAISGFHALVATGTTSKQLSKAGDARLIGYGSMLGESALAVAATIAVSTGFKSAEDWHIHYDGFEAASTMSASLAAFVNGTSQFLQPILDILTIEEKTGQSLAAVFISVLIISFAATSLDTAVRIQRYVLSEAGMATGLTGKDNRYLYSGLAVFFSLFLVFTGTSGSGGMILWPLFGTTNQLLAALTLMVITIWLYKNGRNYLLTLIPMVILLCIVSVAAFYNLIAFYREGNYLLLAIDSIVIICFLWLLFEGLRFIRGRGNERS